MFLSQIINISVLWFFYHVKQNLNGIEEKDNGNPLDQFFE